MKTQLTILTESPALRQRVCGGEAKNLLDRCGNLEYLREREAVTKAAVCQYYGVPVGSLKSILNRHRKEFDKFGYNVLSKKDFERLQNATLKSKARRIAIFPPPAILLVGLLLRDSEVAQRLRSVIWQNLLTKREEYFDEEVLLESRSFRDSYSTEENLSILDLVGLLATLPDTAWSTVEQVAEYYGVTYEAIKKLVQRNKQELEGDGYRLLSRKDLAWGQVVPSLNATTSRLAIFTRRAILRVGMLLRDSKVAREVRSYLLHAESLAPWRREKEAVVPAPVPYATKADLEGLREEIKIQRREFRQEISALEERRNEDKERLKDDLLFLLTSLREMDTRLKEGLNLLLGVLAEQLAEQEALWKRDMTKIENQLEDQRKKERAFILRSFEDQEAWWKKEFWKRMSEEEAYLESQLDEIRRQIEALFQRLDLIKQKLHELENRPAKDDQRFQGWKNRLNHSMGEVSRSLDQLFAVLAQWEGYF